MRKLICCTLLFCAFGFGAISNTMQWDVRTTGSDTAAAGGYDPGVSAPGTDASQGTATAFSDLIAAGSTATSVSLAFSATTHGPGNTILITGGSGCTTGVFEMLSQAAGVGMFDRSMGTGTCTGYFGGSLATPCSAWSGGCTAGAFAWISSASGGYNTVWVKAGTYTCATALVSNSCYENINVFGQSASVEVRGYSSTHGDLPTNPINLGSNPLFTTSVATLQIFNESGNYVFVAVSFSNTVASGSPYALVANVNSGYLYVTASRFDISGTTAGEGIYEQYTYGTTIWASEFKGNSTGACIADLGSANQKGALWVGQGTYVHGCGEGIWDYNNNGNQAWYVSDSVFASNGRHIYQQAGGQLLSIHASAFYNATNEAAKVNPNSDPDFVLNVDNSIFWGGTYALSLTNAANPAYSDNAYGNFSTANWNNATPVMVGVPDITLTAIPWVSASTGNFTLNTTAGGGALLVSPAGYPGSSPAGTGYLAVGPLQPQSSSGGGSAPHAYVQ